jgi:hypothetical protein
MKEICSLGRRVRNAHQEDHGCVDEMVRRDKSHVVDSGNPFGPGKEITKAGMKELSHDKKCSNGLHDHQCRKRCLPLVCPQGVRGSNPLVSTRHGPALLQLTFSLVTT